MNKKKVVITCICFAIVIVAVIGMAVVRFGGSGDGSKDNTVMNNDGAVQGDVNKDENGTSNSDKNDKTDTSGGNNGNVSGNSTADNNSQSGADSEVKIPVTNDVEATMGGVKLNEEIDDPFENGTASNGNTGNTGSGNSGSSSDTNTSGDNGNAGVDAGTSLTYEEYNAMSSSEQQAFFDSFDDPAEFFEWYQEAKAEYDEAHPDIEVGNGEIDLGNIGN